MPLELPSTPPLGGSTPTPSPSTGEAQPLASPEELQTLTHRVGDQGVTTLNIDTNAATPAAGPSDGEENRSLEGRGTNLTVPIETFPYERGVGKKAGIQPTDQTVSPKVQEARKALANKFKVGDIVFTKANEKGADLLFVDRVIRQMQRFSHWVFKDKVSNEQAQTDLVHCSIVVGVNTDTGEVLIAEAMPEKKKKGQAVRIVDLLSYNSCQIGPGSAYEYEVMRINENKEKMAVTASKVAEKIGVKKQLFKPQQPSDVAEPSSVQSQKPQKLKTTYSWKVGFKALFKSGRKVDLEAKKSMYRAIFDQATKGREKAAQKKARPFVCSSFVAHVLQRAAIKATLRDNFGELGISPEARTKDVEAWVDQQVKQETKESQVLEKVIPDEEFRVNVDRIKPFELRQMVAKQFQPVLRIIPPQQ